MHSRAGAIGLAAFVAAAAVALYLYSARPEPPRRGDAGPAVSDRSEAAPSAPAPPARAPAATPPPPTRTLPRDPAADPAPSAPAPAEAADRGTLVIASDVAGAQVFLDRNFLGVTPLTVPDVAPGPHQLNVTAEGHDGVAETIDVAPGRREITIAFKTVRLDARINVVHKHGVGSCQGILSAAPDGLRYDTTHKDDAFAAPLGDLDAFAVDYGAKNLRLKMKNGRTYNFADPDGNADRLFVFHRDVEKVRARLAPGR